MWQQMSMFDGEKLHLDSFSQMLGQMYHRAASPMKHIWITYERDYLILMTRKRDVQARNYMEKDCSAVIANRCGCSSVARIVNSLNWPVSIN